MKTKSFLLVAIAASLFTVGCKKSNTTDSSGVSFQLKAVNPSSTLNRVSATITWESGFVNANQLKFEAKQAGTEREFKSNIQQHVDLFGALTNIGNISVPAGTYDETEFKIFAAPANSEPAVQLQGKFNNIPVIFRVDNSILIKAEQHQVVLTGSSTALTTINLAGLTQGIASADFTNATQTNGTIVISSSSNTNLYNTILANFQKQGETEVEVHHH